MPLLVGVWLEQLVCMCPGAAAVAAAAGDSAGPREGSGRCLPGLHRQPQRSPPGKQAFVCLCIDVAMHACVLCSAHFAWV
jgi:hypothetical protein